MIITAFLMQFSVSVATGVGLVLLFFVWVLLLHRQIKRSSKAEQALRRRNEQLELIARSSHIGLWSADLLTDRVLYDRSWYSLTGYDQDAMEDKSGAFWALVHPDDEPELRSSIEQMVGKGAGALRSEYRFKHAKGGWVWMYRHARFTEFGSDGQPTRMVGMDQDISSLHEMRDARQQSEREKLLILSSVPDSILYLDKTLKVVWANGNARQLFDSDPVGRTCHSLWHCNESPCSACTVQSSLKIGQPMREELRMENGRMFDINVAPVVDDAGELLGCVQVATDVTSAREVEEKLRQSQKMDVVGRLAGGIAHDFNNLLQVIIGYGELALECAEEPDLREHLAAVMSAAERGEALVRQLLSFGRKRPERRAVIDLNNVVDPLVPMLRKLIGEDVDLVHFPGDTVPMVFADASELERVVLNLGTNARDAMPEGGELSIATYGQFVLEDSPLPNLALKPGHYAVLRISDDGNGMSPDVVEHAFDPFFTTKQEGRGSGLGLTAVYGAISAADGTIDLESKEGVGTTFTFYLPAVDEDIPDSEEVVLPVSTFDLSGRTVLVAEDEHDVRALSIRILESAGCRVVAAVDGAEAIDKVKKYGAELDLLMLDVVMPHSSGGDVAAVAAQLYPSLPVLFCSAYLGRGLPDIELMNNARFLRKPYSRGELLGEIGRML